MADDGEHLGGELGQPGARVRVSGRHAGIGCRALPRGRARRRSRDQALHRVAGTGIPELRAVADCRSAAAAVHLQDDARRRSNRIRRALRASTDSKGRGHAGRCHADAGATAGTGRHTRGAERHGVRGGHAPEGGLGHGRRQPRERQWLRAGRSPARGDRRRRRRPHRVAGHDPGRPRRASRHQPVVGRARLSRERTSSSRPASSA